MESTSLLLSPTPEAYGVKRGLRRSEVRPVTHRHSFVLELHMAGHSVHEIAELSGYAETTIYAILSSDNVIGLKQQIMFYYDEEFSALYPDVVLAVKKGLTSDIQAERMDAAKTWLKAHGKLQDKNTSSGPNINLTAEDVVINILNQRQDDDARSTGS